MKLFKTISKWYNSTISSWHLRNWTMLIIAFLSLLYLGFDKTVLDLLAMAILFVSISVPLSGFAIWGLTRIPFVNNQDNYSITGVFRAIMIVIAALIISYYFAK